MNKQFIFLLLLFSQLTTAQTPVYSTNGMVVSAHPLASQVGIDILKQGGNAADATVAVQFALAVVYPNAGNIGGGGFLVYRSKDGNATTLDYRETAPRKASRNMYLDEKGDAVTEKSLYGGLAVGVPGTIAGMVEFHKKYGKLSWKKVILPAIQLARNGFSLTEKQANELNNNQDFFLKFNPDGCVFINPTKWKVGDVLKQTDLANTLELIARKGIDGFYKEKTAQQIVEQMKQSGGIISFEDLKNYKVIWRNPLFGTYKEYKIISMPPPSSGGIGLLTLLKSVERYPIHKWGFQSDSTVQIMVETERRAYADRAEYLGDPDYWKVPQKTLLDSNYIHKRMSDIQFSHATPSSEVKAGDLTPYESDQTTHFCVVDKDRNAVSVTTTLNGSYGSKVVVKGAGFLLNNEMDDFSVKPGTPNQYGLVGTDANAIEPGKRMLSSMTPTILEKNNNLYMVVGSPGGSTIITSVFQTILNQLEFGFDAAKAVSLPRFHHQWLPDEVQAEKGAISEGTRKILFEKGYKIAPRSAYGRVEAIVVKGQQLEGGADPRGDDAAKGY